MSTAILILKAIAVMFIIVGGIFSLMAIAVAGWKSAPYVLVGIIVIESIVLFYLLYKEFWK